LRLHLEVGKDMRVRRGFGMLFRNRLFAGAGWTINAVYSIRRGRLLPLGIEALPLPLNQRPNGIDFCSRHADPEKRTRTYYERVLYANSIPACHSTHAVFLHVR
jgi:hypothetical protein